MSSNMIHGYCLTEKHLFVIDSVLSVCLSFFCLSVVKLTVVNFSFRNNFRIVRVGDFKNI